MDPVAQHKCACKTNHAWSIENEKLYRRKLNNPTSFFFPNTKLTMRNKLAHKKIIITLEDIRNQFVATKLEKKKVSTRVVQRGQ